MAKRLAIIRSGGSVLDPHSYNCQETGLAKALARRGWEVAVIMASGRNAEESIETSGQGAVKIFYVRYKALNQALAWFEDIEGLLDRIAPNIIQIHEFSMLMSWRVVRYARRHEIPTVLVQGSYQATRKPVFRQLEELFNRTLGRYVLCNVKGIGCKTPSAAEYVNSCHRRPCHSTPVGLDESRFSGSGTTKARETGAGKKLLYVGVLEPRRNPLFLLELMRKLPEDYTLTIVGDGPLSDMVFATVQNYGLRDRVTLCGKMKQEALIPVYKSHDLFLLPSDYEIFGMVILEALYFGLPVISTPTAGTGEIMSEEFSEYIMDGKDPDAWAEAIVRYCNLPANRKSAISGRCAQYVRDRYVWDSAVANFEKLYLEALQ